MKETRRGKRRGEREVEGSERELNGGQGCERGR